MARRILAALVLVLALAATAGGYDANYSPGGNNVTWPVGP